MQAVKRANIIKVAELANVSAMTVTRAFNGSAPVAAKTKSKIMKIATELGYRPNVMAQSLRSGKTNSIGILWSLDAEVVRDLTLGLMEKGYISYLTDSLSDTKIINISLQDYINRNVAGLIIQNNGELFKSSKTIELLRKIPVVTVINEDAGDSKLTVPENLKCTVISRNNCAPWREIIEHFKNTGRKRIVLLGQKLGTIRENAYLHYLKQFGFPTDESRIFTESGTNIVLTPEIKTQLLSKQLQYDAILTTNDEWAAAVTGLFVQHKIKVPQQVAIAGFNDEKMSRHFIPPLASVDRREKELTGMLLEDLFKRLANPDLPQHFETLEMKFIHRKSAG